MTVRIPTWGRAHLSRLAGPSMIVYAGGVARAGLAFLMNMVVARWFSPDEFGVYYSFIVVAMIVHGVFGEGLDPAVVRSYAHSAANEPGRKRIVVGSALVLRLAIGTPLILACTVWSEWFAGLIFGDPAHAQALLLGLGTGLATAFLGFALAILQGREEFRIRAALTPLLNLLRLVLVPIFIVAGIFVLPTILWAHAVLALGCCLIGFWAVRSDLTDMSASREQIVELFQVSKWSVVVYFSYFGYCYLGIPALSYFHGSAESGIFAAAAALMMVIETAIAAVTVVQLPAVSKLTSVGAFRKYVRRAAPVYAGISLALLPLIFAASYIVTLIYGDSYQESASALRILVLGGLVHFIAAPLSMVFYGIKRPELFAFTQVVSLIAWAIAAVVLIPPFSIQGAALATLIARLISGVLIFALLWRILRAGTVAETGAG